MNKLRVFLFKARVSIEHIFMVLKQPVYFAIAVLVSVLASSLIIWSLNLELVSYILIDAPITIVSKLQFFIETYKDIFITYSSVNATGILVLSVLFGSNTAMLIYVLRNHNERKKTLRASRASNAGLLAAIISGGCIVCGTSLLAPFALMFGATSSIYLHTFSNVLNLISIFFMLISLYQLGKLVPRPSAHGKD